MEKMTNYPQKKGGPLQTLKNKSRIWKTIFWWPNYRGEKYNKVAMFGLNVQTQANEMMKEISSAEKIYDDDRMKLTCLYDGRLVLEDRRLKWNNYWYGINRTSGEIIETPIIAIKRVCHGIF